MRTHFIPGTAIPRKMEDGTEVNTWQEFRNYLRLQLKQKTFHGIPKTYNKFLSFAQIYKITETLSKGHTSEKHVKAHKQNEFATISTAEERINTALRAYRDKTGIPCHFTAIREKAPAIDRKANIGIMKAGSGRAFSLNMTKTPFKRRIKNNVVKYKLARPVRIILLPISLKRFEMYVAKKVVNNKGNTPMYKKATNIAYRHRKGAKTQVVHPN